MNVHGWFPAKVHCLSVIMMIAEPIYYGSSVVNTPSKAIEEIHNLFENVI